MASVQDCRNKDSFLLFTCHSCEYLVHFSVGLMPGRHGDMNFECSERNAFHSQISEIKIYFVTHRNKNFQEQGGQKFID